MYHGIFYELIPDMLKTLLVPPSTYCVRCWGDSNAGTGGQRRNHVQEGGETVGLVVWCTWRKLFEKHNIGKAVLLKNTRPNYLRDLNPQTFL